MNGGEFSSRELDTLLVGIDERDLVDLIEGQIDADRRHDLETMLIKRPGLRRLVEAMRHDRAVMRAMPDEFCHADVAAGVRDVLEREALLGASGLESEPDAPAPIAMTSRRIGARPLAFAAGLLLLVGGGAILAWPRFITPGPSGPLSNSSSIAMNDPRADGTRERSTGERRSAPAATPNVATKSDSARDESSPVATTDAAATSPVGVASEDRALAESDAASVAASKEAASPVEPQVGLLAQSRPAPEDEPAMVGPEIPVDLALARSTEAPIDDRRAAELALQGRLLVRVQGASAAYLLSSSADRGALGTHRVDHVEPSELSSPVLAQVFEGTTTPERIVWASDHAMPVYDREVVGPEGYVVEFAATPQNVEKLREELGGRVTFEELHEDAGLRPRIDPDAVLWWTLPPSAWAPRVAAPIILEH